MLLVGAGSPPTIRGLSLYVCDVISVAFAVAHWIIWRVRRRINLLVGIFVVLL